jgi:hypothetical protein
MSEHFFNKMEEGDIKDPEETAKALETLDIAIDKLRKWVLTEVLPHFKASEEEIYRMRTLMNIDSLLFVPPLRDFLVNYKQQLKALDVDFFRALFPVEYKNVEIPVSLQRKGFLFAEVFESILKDIDQ